MANGNAIRTLRGGIHARRSSRWRKTNASTVLSVSSRRERHGPGRGLHVDDRGPPRGGSLPAQLCHQDPRAILCRDRARPAVHGPRCPTTPRACPRSSRRSPGTGDRSRGLGSRGRRAASEPAVSQLSRPMRGCSRRGTVRSTSRRSATPRRSPCCHVCDSPDRGRRPSGHGWRRPSLLDLGSGGGYPGLPLGGRPARRRVALVESVGEEGTLPGRRVTRGIRALVDGGLDAPAIQVMTERAEDLARDPDQRAAGTS